MSICKRIFGLTLLALSAAAFSGCEAFRQASYEPSYVLTFYTHVRYPGRGDIIEKEVVDPFTGKIYWVNGNQFFDSRSIKEAQCEPAPGETDKYLVYFKLGSGGMSRWTAMCGHNRDARTVLMVDGAFYTIYDQPLMMTDEGDEWVRCDALFDEITAKGIVKHAGDNYTYFNPDASSWLKF